MSAPAVLRPEPKLLYAPSDDLKIRLNIDHAFRNENCCAAPYLINGPTSALITALAGTVFTPADPSRLQVAVNTPFRNKIDETGGSAQVDWSRDGVTVTSITSYRDWRALQLGDADYSDVDILNQSVRDQNKLFTQELRLNGTAGPVDWLVGAYYFDEQVARQRSVTFGTQTGAYFAALAKRPTIAALYLVGGGSVSERYAQSAKGLSFFTHDIIKITDLLKLTLGLRYSTEDKKGSGAFVANSPACVPLAGTSLAIQCPRPDYQAKRSDSRWTGTAQLSYQLRRDVLGYVSYASGFKAGGINLDRDATLTSTTFLPETVDSYEIGLKSRIPSIGLTVNVAAFLADYSNFQLNVFNGIGFTVSNAAGVRSKGVEIETSLRPIRGLDISAAATYNVARYTDATADATLRGKQITSAPEWTVNGAVSYEYDRGNIHPFGSVGASYRSSVNTGSALLPQMVERAVTIVNGRVGIRLASDKIELSLFANNLFDIRYSEIIFSSVAQTGSFNAFPAEPRIFGGAVAVRF